MLYFRQFYTRVWSVRQQSIVFAFPAIAYHKPSGICVVLHLPVIFSHRNVHAQCFTRAAMQAGMLKTRPP